MAVEVRWVGPPRNYTRGRRRPVQFVVLHYTAGAEGPETAEAGASYDKRRTDGVSTHYFTDSRGPALQEVADGDRAHCARFHGNEIGIHIEICGTRQTRAQWLDPVSRATLQTTAALTAMLCQRHGFPVVRLTTAQTRAAYYAPEGSRPKGITDHNACTFAFPEDGGDHTDVGPGFPWDVFMLMVLAEMEDDMPTVDEYAKAAAKATWDHIIASAALGRSAPAADWLKSGYALERLGLAARLDAVLAAALDDGDVTVIVDEAIKADVAALRAELAALPEGFRAIVDTELDEQARAGADAD